MGPDLDKFGAPDEDAALRARQFRMRALKKAALDPRDPDYEPLPEDLEDDDC